MTETPACPHCPDGHRDPWTRPWHVRVASQVDSDGQPTHLMVMPTNGAHVAQSDADWLWQLIRGYWPGPRPVPEPEPEPQRTTGRWGRGA